MTESTTLKEFRAGLITPEEVCRRIEARIAAKRRLEESVGAESPDTKCDDVPVQKSKRLRELKAPVKCGKRAPIPFPSKVVLESGDNFELISYTDGLASFGEKGQVRVSTVKKDGSVGGVPQIVDLVVAITYMDTPIYFVEGRVTESD